MSAACSFHISGTRPVKRVLVIGGGDSQVGAVVAAPIGPLQARQRCAIVVARSAVVAPGTRLANSISGMCAVVASVLTTNTRGCGLASEAHTARVSSAAQARRVR